jgi:hypothetical protein
VTLPPSDPMRNGYTTLADVWTAVVGEDQPPPSDLTLRTTLAEATNHLAKAQSKIMLLALAVREWEGFDALSQRLVARIEELKAQVAKLTLERDRARDFAAIVATTTIASSPDDLREKHWRVAIHNDYFLDGEPHTFWLFTRGANSVKGEARTDAEALALVREQIERMELEGE